MADASIEITRTKKKNAHRWAQMSASGRGGGLLLINDDRVMDSIYDMLSSLTDTNKKWLADHLYKDISKNKVVKTKSESLSDEELAARLSQFPSWDEVDHADLSSINYSNYKPFKSPKTKEVISKWL